MERITVEYRHCVVEKTTNKILVMEREKSKAEHLASKSHKYTIRKIKITTTIEFLDQLYRPDTIVSGYTLQNGGYYHVIRVYNQRLCLPPFS